MKKRVLGLLIALVGFSINTCTFANQDELFKKTMEFAKQQNQHTLDRLKTYQPRAYVDKYTDKPPEAKYYEGGTQTNTENLNRAAQRTLQNEHAKTVSESIHVRPQFQINPESEMIVHSALVQREAENIVRGISNEHVNCQSQPICETTYTTKSCQKARFNQTMSCNKNLIVNAMPVENSFQTLVALVQGIPNKKAKRIVVNLDLMNEIVLGHNGSQATLVVQGKPPIGACPDVEVTLESITNNYPKNKVEAVVLGHPSCQNGFKMSLQLTSESGNGRALHVIVKYAIRAKQNPVIQESWSSQCDYFDTLKTQGICQVEREECTQGHGSKDINGIVVERACWAKKIHYRCDTGGINDTCANMDKTCEQSNSLCIKEKNGVCLGFEQTYQCPDKKCAASINISCGEQQVYCLDGNCVDHSYLASEDFAKGASSLNATAEASKQFDTVTIFNGHAAKCSDDISNFRNCCKDSGWGQDMNLAHCSDDEKKLGANRENQLAIYVGRYCDKEVLGVCVQHKESYCVFDSKMARIIQQQGRAVQLRVGFGKPEKPMCRGITPDELQRLDLSTINFSEMYADINQKMTSHDEKLIQQKIEAQIKQMGGTP